jgi:Arylsulfatase A and related enzymes
MSPSRPLLKLALALVTGVALASTGWTAEGGPQQRERPYNVLVILIDDHGPFLHDVLNARSPVHTPSMQRLARRGTWFTRAYADSPACCPARTALLTGVHAAKSGVYYNNQAYRRASGSIARVENLTQHFLRNGYLTAGYGKIAHNRFLEDEADAFTPGYYKMFNRRGDVRRTDSDLRNFILPGSEVGMWTSGWSWGVLPDDWDRDDPEKQQQDTQQASRTIEFLQQAHERPFMVACGFWRPHVSWTVPKRYFDRFPLESIELPAGFRADDLEDLPPAARWLATHRGEHDYIVKNGLWKQCLQAYYASIAYVDEQIGRVLDALERSPHRDNTIVVFTADNGWHTGEKNHWSKFYLSELGCRVVMSISVPGFAPQVVNTPVGHIDLYPTLASLCGLPGPATHRLDGVDLTPVLAGERVDRGGPVLSTYGPECHSVRDDRFRYTRYRDGTEELYDHEQDPHEWNNLAGDSRFAAVKAHLATFLPERSAPEVEPANPEEPHDANAWDDEVFGSVKQG